MSIAFIVLARVVTNPLTNVFQKQLTQRSAHPLFVIAATHGVLTAFALPLLFVRQPLAALGAEFWSYMLGAAMLAVVGNVLLVYALRSADLSVLGPINAYKSVLSVVIAFILIGELPTRFGFVGVMLIVAGSYFVIDRVPGQARSGAFREFLRAPGVRLRFAAILCSATEAVLLKRALLISSPLTTFLLWVVVGFLLAAFSAAWILRFAALRGEVIRLQQEWRRYGALATTTAVMQLATLLTFAKVQVGYSLALFQLSAIVTVYLGHRYFREANLRRRLFGSLIMVIGAMLIVSLGRRA